MPRWHRDVRSAQACAQTSPWLPAHHGPLGWLSPDTLPPDVRAPPRRKEPPLPPLRKQHATRTHPGLGSCTSLPWRVYMSLSASPQWIWAPRRQSMPQSLLSTRTGTSGMWQKGHHHVLNCNLFTLIEKCINILAPWKPCFDFSRKTGRN